ncbi:hypothetical protein KI387_017303, partial [Taxus chinensis]
DLNLHFNPHMMLLRMRDEKEMLKQEWAEQLESLKQLNKSDNLLSSFDAVDV